MNLSESAIGLRKAISAQGLNRPTEKNQLANLNRAIEYCTGIDEDIDIKEALKRYYAHVKSLMIEDEISAYQLSNEVRMINFVQKYCQLGNITGNKSYEPRISRYRQPTEYYRQLLSEFENTYANVYTPATLSCTRASIRDFIFYLEDNSVNNVSEIGYDVMSDYILALFGKYNSNISHVLGRVRIFCRHLANRGLIDHRMEQCLKVRSAKRTKLREGFTLEEVDRIIAAVDKSSTVGKRNYAMLLLGKYTGLRGIDVRELKRKDIDWEQKEISIIQHKTQKPLKLPLENVVGNAIADYLENIRPDCSCDNVFVTASAPFVPLSKSTLSDAVKNAAANAGIEWASSERKGFHSFRHAMATNLLASDISPDMIAEVLGHASPKSTKPYYSTNIEKLRMCAMPITDFMCARKELLV